MEDSRIIKQKCLRSVILCLILAEQVWEEERDLMFHLDILIWRGMLTRWLLRH